MGCDEFGWAGLRLRISLRRVTRLNLDADVA